MREDRHWEYDDEPNYIKVTPYERIRSEQKVVDDIEVDDGDEDGDIRTVLVHYHYTELSSSCSRMEPDEPASVEIISIIELLAIPEVTVGVLLYQGEYSVGRTLYALDGTDLIPDKAFKDLEQYLLEGGI